METLSNILGNIGALIFAIVAFGFCIIIHEFGHFVAAKLCKLHVFAFSVGFCSFWRKKVGEVEYRIGYLPFGGYCDIPQIDSSSDVPETQDGQKLERGKPWQRIVTAFAGPLFNILGGLFLCVFVWYFGIPQNSPVVSEFVVATINEDGPEYQAGLRVGDKIVEINGKNFNLSWNAFSGKFAVSVGKTELTYVRNGEKHKISFYPAVNKNSASTLVREQIAMPNFMPTLQQEIYPEPNSPASRAGIKEGDILTAINGKALIIGDDILGDIAYGDGNPLKISVLRDGKPMDFMVTPEKMSDNEIKMYQFDRPLCGFMMQGDGKSISVVKIVNNSPASRAKMLKDDKILKINGEEIKDCQQVRNMIQNSNGKEMKFVVNRGNQELTLQLTPVRLQPYTIRVQFKCLGHPTPFSVFEDTLSNTFTMLHGLAVTIGSKLGLTTTTSTIKPSHLSGPLGIGDALFKVAKRSSITSCINFVAIISFALAIFNLLPLPVLDGGHITFGLIEIIIRRPIPGKVVKYISVVFILLLLSLMLYATFCDGRRFIRNNFIPEGCAVCHKEKAE